MKKTKLFAVVIGIILVFLAISIAINWGKFFPEKGSAEKAAAVAPVHHEGAKPEAMPVEVKVEKEKIDTLVTMPPKGEKEPAVTPKVAESPELRRIKKSAKNHYERLNDDVRIFFDYLDARDYAQAYTVEGGTEKLFLDLLAKLSANPPVISGETQDIYTLTHNMAHFYRIIGKENIALGKEILTREREIAEPAMEMLYEWVTEGIKKNKGEIRTSVNDLFEYASFFLGTLSGKAYLARRDSKTRILVIYYSLLILDTANRNDLNRHGIDILPPLNLLTDDIENYANLDGRDKYLRRLWYIKRRVVSQRERGEIRY